MVGTPLLESFLKAQKRALRKKRGGGDSGTRYAKFQLVDIFTKGLENLARVLQITNSKHFDLNIQKDALREKSQAHTRSKKEHERFDDLSAIDNSPASFSFPTITAKKKRESRRKRNLVAYRGIQTEPSSPQLPFLQSTDVSPEARLRLVPRDSRKLHGEAPYLQQNPAHTPAPSLFIRLAGLSSANELTEREQQRVSQLCRLTEMLQILQERDVGTSLLHRVQQTLEKQTQAFIGQVAHHLKKPAPQKQQSKKTQLKREEALAKASLQRQRRVFATKKDLWNTAIDRELAPLHAESVRKYICTHVHFKYVTAHHLYVVVAEPEC